MERKTFNIYKKEIRRLLRQLDNSFDPKAVCLNSTFLRDLSTLRYIVDDFCNDLKNDYNEK